jgi:DNA-binding XRE family transcriptional regulator
MTQSELANLTGFSEPTIVKYEKNELDMKVSTALLIAEKLGVVFDGLRFCIANNDDPAPTCEDTQRGDES